MCGFGNLFLDTRKTTETQAQQTKQLLVVYIHVKRIPTLSCPLRESLKLFTMQDGFLLWQLNDFQKNQKGLVFIVFLSSW